MSLATLAHSPARRLATANAFWNEISHAGILPRSFNKRYCSTTHDISPTRRQAFSRALMESSPVKGGALRIREGNPSRGCATATGEAVVQESTIKRIGRNRMHDSPTNERLARAQMTEGAGTRIRSTWHPLVPRH